MARHLITAAALLLAVYGSPAAAQPADDYSSIRGVNYGSGYRNDQATIERDLGYAKRLNLNSLRVWLSYRRYQEDPEGFLDSVENFVRTGHRLGFTTMPILFNGNGLDPATLEEGFRPEGDAFVRAVVDRL